MLLQIVVDEAGVYYYSELAAEQILDMFQSEILGSRNNFNRLTDRTKERSVSR